jgi:hypothetical protein
LAGAPCAPSCGGIDGLTPGATLVFNLDRGDRPQVYSPPHCFAYTTLGLQGVSGVAFGVPSAPTDDAFTRVYGPFVSPTEQGCSGDWGLELQPRDPLMPGQVASPLDAGATSPWVVVRTMQIPQAQFCGSAFAVRGAVVCGDVFTVDSIAEVSGP